MTHHHDPTFYAELAAGDAAALAVLAARGVPAAAWDAEGAPSSPEEAAAVDAAAHAFRRAAARAARIAHDP